MEVCVRASMEAVKGHGKLPWKLARVGLHGSYHISLDDFQNPYPNPYLNSKRDRPPIVRALGMYHSSRSPDDGEVLKGKAKPRLRAFGNRPAASLECG